MTTSPATMQPLNCDRDAARWAREFNEVIVKMGVQPFDPGFLIGWFANAMMCGEDTYRWRTESETGATISHDLLGKIRAELFNGKPTAQYVLMELDEALSGRRSPPSATAVIHRPDWDGWIRFDSDCIINGTPVKAGTSWGPFEKSRNPLRTPSPERAPDTHPIQMTEDRYHELLGYEAECLLRKPEAASKAVGLLREILEVLEAGTPRGVTNMRELKGRVAWIGRMRPVRERIRGYLESLQPQERATE